MHLRRRAQDHCIDFWQSQAVCQIGGDMTNAIFVRNFFGLVEFAANQGNDFNAIDIFDAVQVLDAKCARACQCDFNGLRHVDFLSSKLVF